MKNQISKSTPAILPILLGLLMFGSANKLFGQTETNKLFYDQIVAAISNYDDESGYGIVKQLFIDDAAHRGKIIRELIEILNDPNSNSRAKCYAAYYLGELRSSEAVDSLAAHITVSAYSGGGHLFDMEASWNGHTSASALGAIGIKSIPPLIRNLADSDDAKTRELSLQVLYRIEGDKDIVQLRLQKALAAEKDSQKQARLQTALKSLAETSF